MDKSSRRTLPVDWWTAYGDPHLNALVRAALERNTELTIARARVDEASAATRRARASCSPRCPRARRQLEDATIQRTLQSAMMAAPRCPHRGRQTCRDGFRRQQKVRAWMRWQPNKRGLPRGGRSRLKQCRRLCSSAKPVARSASRGAAGIRRTTRLADATEVRGRTSYRLRHRAYPRRRRRTARGARATAACARRGDACTRCTSGTNARSACSFPNSCVARRPGLDTDTHTCGPAE